MILEFLKIEITGHVSVSKSLLQKRYLVEALFVCN